MLQSISLVNRRQICTLSEQPVIDKLTSQLILTGMLTQPKSGCDVFEKQYMSIPGAIASASFLSILGVLGVVGNVLVIVVYCVRPRRAPPRPYIVITPPHAMDSGLEPTTPPTPAVKRCTSFQDVQSNRTRKSTQACLILVLAVVDLATCLLILPWDVFRSVRFTLFANSTVMSEEVDFLTLSLTSYDLDEILNLLRNVAFAGEGSILAAIAMERFLVVVPRSQMTCRPMIRLCCKQESDISRPPSLRSLPNSTKQVPEQTSQKSMEEADRSMCRNSHCCLLCPTCPFVWSCQETTKRKAVIWGIILIVCSSVFLLELVILLLHFDSIQCALANRLRELTDKSYIVCTLLSFILISYLYLSIFLIVRQTDMRKRSWKMHSTLRRRAEDPENGAAMIQVQNGQRNQDTYASTADAKLLDDVNTITGPDKRIPFELARRYKYVSFTTSTTTNTTTSVAVIRSAVPDDGMTVSGIPATTIRTSPASVIAYTPWTATPRPRPSQLRSRRAGLMLFTSTIVFYATLFPVLWVHFNWWSEDNHQPITAQHGLNTPRAHSKVGVHHEFYYVNNAINVFVYSLFNSRFRERLKTLLGQSTVNNNGEVLDDND
ncbi:hypothetical protein P879_00437 [Paragonimus westermani]|uniref:G-protein coupled receptors family 1 profile domain-containing protein n=1 Tax=Paragonimus westermani TaxID=34504 RepID=A0A8T0DSK2_9TREM|nr:hypothetical protein P879_00437 [Paragonimus westermani]